MTKGMGPAARVAKGLLPLLSTPLVPLRLVAMKRMLFTLPIVRVSEFMYVLIALIVPTVVGTTLARLITL